MKISLSLFEKPAPAVRMGSALQPRTVQPWHAAALREQAEFNQRQMRAYDAAITTNLNQDFPMTVGSPNAEILNSLYIARGRNRTLKKDFPTAKGIDRTFRNNVCGDDPFRLEMKVGTRSGKTFTLETDTNQLIQDAWAEAMRPENCTVRRDIRRLELYHAVISSAIGAGGVLVRHHRAFPNNQFKYALELIAIDRLQESYMGVNPDNGNEIRFSIERDKYNAPVAYWILTRHPGDVFAYNGFKPKVIRERVPAEDIIHFNNLRTEPEQDIGFSEFDSIIQSLHRDRQFDIAHVTAATWSCAKPFWITQELPSGNNYAGDPDAMAQYNNGSSSYASASQGLDNGNGQGGGRDKVKMVEPGTGEILPFGMKAQQLDPKFPIEAATSFKRDNLLAAATGAGLSYGSASSDFEKYSFSTARAAQVPERDNFKVYQKHMALSFVTQHFEAWLLNLLLTGTTGLSISRYKEFCRAATFHAKRWPYINPLQDVQADVIALETGLKSRQEILAESENGRTVEDIDSDVAAAKEIDEAHGLDFSPEPETPTLKKGEPNPTDQPDPQPPGKKSKLDTLIARANTTLALNGDRH